MSTCYSLIDAWVSILDCRLRQVFKNDLEPIAPLSSNTAIAIIHIPFSSWAKYDKTTLQKKPQKNDRQGETSSSLPLSRYCHVRAVFPEAVSFGGVGRRRSGQVGADVAVRAAQLYRLPRSDDRGRIPTGEGGNVTHPSSASFLGSRSSVSIHGWRVLRNSSNLFNQKKTDAFHKQITKLFLVIEMLLTIAEDGDRRRAMLAGHPRHGRAGGVHRHAGAVHEGRRGVYHLLLCRRQTFLPRGRGVQEPHPEGASPRVTL